MERMPQQQQQPLTGGAQAQGPPPRRLSEPAKFLPVAFLVCTILVLYLIYVLTHCLSLLQVDVEYQHQDDTMKRRGLVQLAVFHYVTLLLVICYARCVLESPGEIPRDDPCWIHVPSQDRSLAGGVVALNLQEMKKSGDRRHCKWCSRFKPDRCHHCRVCRKCILKMDHHCPWIYNCVGFKNYKFFFLLLFYSCVDTHFIVWTMSESVRRSVESQAPFMTMFLHVFGVTLALWMGLILTLFFGFHVWLVSRAMTIIEFCEKSTSQPGPRGGRDGLSSAYDQGCLENVRAALGANPLLWLLPLCPPDGDGLSFATAAEAAEAAGAAGAGVTQPLLPSRGRGGVGEAAAAHEGQRGRQKSDGPRDADRPGDRLGPAQYR